MSISIFQTREQALWEAKRLAIRQFEDWNKVHVHDGNAMADDSIWLVRPLSCRCTCGESPAVEAVLFGNKITFEAHMLTPAGRVTYPEQFNGIAGYCDTCGEEGNV